MKRRLHFLPVLLFSSLIFAPPSRALDKIVFAAFTDTAPVIDGDLSDACWRKAEPVDDFTLISSPDVSAAKRTVFQALYDAGHLYLGVDCWVGDTSAIAAPPQDAGVTDQYTSQYSIEVFIDPQQTKVNYYQLAWSLGGRRYDGFRMAAEGYNGTWIFRTRRLPDRWVSEVAIPLKELRNAAPVPGATWGFNIVRNDVANYSIWKNSGGAFHTPALFGTLLIGGYTEWWQEVVEEGVIPDLEKFRTENAAAIAGSGYLRGLIRRTAVLEKNIRAYGRPPEGISREDMQERYRNAAQLATLVSMMQRHVLWSNTVLHPAKAAPLTRGRQARGT